MGRSRNELWENTTMPLGRKPFASGSVTRTGLECLRQTGAPHSNFADTFSSSRRTLLDRAQPIEQIVTHPPVAVFEVLSPEDTMQRLKRKLEDYRIMGIRKYG